MGRKDRQGIVFSTSSLQSIPNKITKMILSKMVRKKTHQAIRAKIQISYLRRSKRLSLRITLTRMPTHGA